MICVGALATSSKNTRQRLDAVRTRGPSLPFLQPPPVMYGRRGNSRTVKSIVQLLDVDIEISNHTNNDILRNMDQFHLQLKHELRYN